MYAAGKVPFYVALFVAGLTFAITVRFNAFIAPYSDPAGYIGAGARWVAGEIEKPMPFQFQPQFPDYINVGSPLAYRPSARGGTDVEEVALGLPVLVAAAMMIGGDLAPHLIGPLALALLAWCTFRVGARLAGSWAGIVAAVLIGASPVSVRHAVYVSSDVPCTALWMLAWLLSLTPRVGSAAAAGAAVAAAVMIRPNTAFLALVPGVLLLIGGTVPTFRWRRWRWGPAGVFGALAAIGPALVLWSNELFYGGPFQASYRAAATSFAWAHVLPNLKLYPGWLVEVHSMAAFSGLAAVLMACWPGSRFASLDIARDGPIDFDRDGSLDGARDLPLDVARDQRAPVEGPAASRVVALSALAIVVVSFASIAAYLNFDQWTYLRFVLPAMAALFILLGALIVWVSRTLMQARWPRWLAPLALAPAALVIWQGLPQVQSALRDWRITHPVLLMGYYLREVVPRNAVVLSFMHGGTVEYFTGRPIMRMDLIAPDLDRVIDLLQRQGYRPVIVLDEVIEAPHMERAYPASQFKELDWPARASFTAYGRIWYLDPADRQAYRAGARYATDVLR
jgi:hypothetical protein